MNRIAELQELITNAKTQRTQARKLRIQPMVTACNHQIRTLEAELMERTA